MSRLVPAFTIALALTLYSPAIACAPIAFSLPDRVQEYQEPEPPEPETITFEATAYTWTGYRTATGVWPSRGTVAVDPRVIPTGSKLWVEGYGEAVAADTGGDIQGQRIDLYMDSEHECLQWGRRKVEVKIRR